MILVLVDGLVSWNSRSRNRIFSQEIGLSKCQVNSYVQDLLAKRYFSKVLLGNEEDEVCLLKCDLERWTTLKKANFRVRCITSGENNVLEKLLEHFEDNVKITVVVRDYKHEWTLPWKDMPITTEMPITADTPSKWNGNGDERSGPDYICKLSETTGAFSWYAFRLFFWRRVFSSGSFTRITAEIPDEIFFDFMKSMEEGDLAKKIREILVGEEASDVVIKARNGARIHGHRCFLLVSSPVLREELMGTDRLDMSFMSEEGIRAFLSYLYCRDVKESKKNGIVASELLWASQEYEVPELETLMIKHLGVMREGEISVNVALNTFTSLGHKDDDSARELKAKCVRIMNANLKELEEIPDYKNLFQTSPETAMELCRLLAGGSVRSVSF